MTAYSWHAQTARQQKKEKRKAQRAEKRRSGLKTTFNEFMESVLETRQEIFHNSLCTLPTVPEEYIMRMLPCRYLDEIQLYIVQLLEENCSPILQEKESLPIP